jgi:hypothetical protein
MIGKVLKTVIWWGLLAVLAFFFLQANAIDSPRAFWEWAEEASFEVRSFFDSTAGQVEPSQIPIQGEEIDIPQESE